MPPDDRKFREQTTLLVTDEDDNQNATIVKVDSEQNVECLSSDLKRIVVDFPCMEQPIRFVLCCKANNKVLSSNSKGRVTASEHRSDNEEFTLTEESDGTLALQSTHHNRYLCSNPMGFVYSAETGHGDAEKWTLTESPHGGFHLMSACSQRILVCSENGTTVRTTDDHNRGPAATWSVQCNSGELCFMSLPSTGMQVRCDLFGKLSMSHNHKGWEAFRFAEVGDGNVRISPYAHGHKFLCSDNKGTVYTTSNSDAWENSLWSVQKAPRGCVGVVIKSATHSRFLGYADKGFSTTESSFYMLEDSAIWHLESAHRQTYYLVCSHNNKRIGTEGPYRDGPCVYTTEFPIRTTAEEWRLEDTDERGVMHLVSQARKEYLASTECGKVFATNSLPTNGDSLKHKWILEESEGGHYLVSNDRYLSCNESGELCTVSRDDPCEETLWRLEPLLPRQVTEKKIKSLATAVTVGLAGTLGAPVILGGAIGLMGIAEAGVAVQVLVGSIRAAEAISTISRMASSSYNLSLGSTSATSNELAKETSDNPVVNRPFSSWKTWQSP